MHWIVQKLRTALHDAKNWLLKLSPIQLIYSKIYYFITGLYIIPKDIAFIWLGSRLPENYKQNILTWPRLNPDYNFHLYIDSGALPLETTVADCKDMQDFCAQNKISLHDVAKMPEFSETVNSPCYNDWLNGEDKRYAFAADYLRLVILYKGGIYSDVDTQCIKSLGTLKNKTGLFVWGSCLLQKEPLFLDNCWMASKYNNLIFLKLTQQMQQNYDNIMFKGILTKHVKNRIANMPLEKDPDVVYKTLRFSSCKNDGDIAFNFGAGSTLNSLYQYTMDNFGVSGIEESVFEWNDKVLHAAHRSWLANRKRERIMGIHLVDEQTYERQIIGQKMTRELMERRNIFALS